jgi:signal transduction histidine kinase
MKKPSRNDPFVVSNSRYFPDVTVPYEEVPVDLSVLVAGMRPRLNEIIGANIIIEVSPEREGLWVNVNARQIEQVVNHLIFNAADIMPRGGTITVETKRINVGPDLVKQKVRESRDF